MRASTLIFAAATMLSRVAGMVREIATAAIFGATAQLSAFTIANQIPNLLRSLVADSALSAAFVPVFTDLREHGETERAWRVAQAIIGLIVVVLGPLTVVAMLAAPWIIAPFMDPSTFSAADIDLAVGLTRLLMPIVLIMAISGVIVGILNAHDKFGAAAIAPVAWNAVILIGLACAGFFAPGHRIWVYAAATLAGTVVQAVLPTYDLRGTGARLGIRPSLRDPRVREVFRLMLPVTISLGLINLQQLIGSGFAGHIDASRLIAGVDPGAGPSIIDKAFRVYMLPQGIFSVAVSTVFFPVLARHASRNDREAFRATVAQGLRQIIVLLVPSAVFLAVFGRPVVQVLYERGAFTPAQTTAVTAALLGFSIGLACNGMSLLLFRSFFSLRRTWIPTISSVITLLANVVLLALMYRPLGVFGIALATSIVNILGVIVLYLLLHRSMGRLDTRRTLVTTFGSIASAVAAVGAAWLAWRATEHWLGDGQLVTLAVVTAALIVSAAIYLQLVARLHIVQHGFVRSLLRRS